MNQHICDACERSFVSADALEMHNKSKHPEKYKKPLLTVRQKKKLRNWIIIVSIVGLIIIAFTALPKKSSSSAPLDVSLSSEQAQQIPPGAVHWHPEVMIIIDGEAVPIPANIGIGIGKVVDTHLSGMRMSPTHTHDTSGTIHVENNNPSSKPETATLGYFFYVWGKTFNSSCIFEYCTDKGKLAMYVDGQESTEFGSYIMQDKDDIRIEYTSGAQDG